MNLTIEVKQYYVKAIDSIWQGGMPSNEIDNITKEVAEAMEEVLTQLVICSRRMIIPHLPFAIFYEFVRFNLRFPEKKLLV